MMWPLTGYDCIAWLALFLSESIAIVTLNVVTLIVFLKNRSFRKRSMYLVINLAVADMLVGGISVIMTFFVSGVKCDLWGYKSTGSERWDNLMMGLQWFFPAFCLANLAMISLERLHATFFPFRHRVTKKWVFGVFITVIWASTLLLFSALFLFQNFKEFGSQYLVYVWGSAISICLFVIFVSYASIVVKISCGAHPQHHGAASRERKLTKTLFIVTLVSLLTWLPYIVVSLLDVATDIMSSLPTLVYVRLYLAFMFLLDANSFVNPILYTIRMPEFRRALVLLFRCRSQQVQAAFPLRVM